MQIKPLKQLAKEAFQDLAKIQRGEKKLVKTGFEIIDQNIGGLLPGDLIVYSGLSGHGKSETLFRTKRNILDTNINEEAGDYVFLDMSLEMKVFNIILREVNNITHKKKSDILFQEFTEEEKEKVSLYYDSLSDERQYINQSPATPMEFYNACMAFMEEHKDKKAVFVTIDHMLLLSGSDKQKTIEATVEYINQLKLRFHNAYFILVSQLNRGILGRVKEKDNNAAPNAADLFASSFLDQIASYNVIIYDPYKTGIEQYMKVNPNRYSYLSDHFGDEDSKGRVSFNTQNRIFYHLEKARESDNPYKNIHIVEKEVNEEQKEMLKQPEMSSKTPNFSLKPEQGKKEMPIFEEPKFDTEKFKTSPEDAFGEEDGDDSAPF